MTNFVMIVLLLLLLLEPSLLLLSDPTINSLALLYNSLSFDKTRVDGVEVFSVGPCCVFGSLFFGKNMFCGWGGVVVLVGYRVSVFLLVVCVCACTCVCVFV